MQNTLARARILFCLALVLSVSVARTLVYMWPLQTLNGPFSLPDLSLHHLHLGIVLVAVSVVWIHYRGYISAVAGALAGSGLGLVLDEFVPSMLLHTDRDEALAAYWRGLAPTTILIAVAVLVVVAAIVVSTRKSYEGVPRPALWTAQF